MKLLIADDEKPARHRLRSLIEELGSGYQIVAEATNGEEVVQHCSTTQPDLVLLDIRMPIMDGINAARELANFASPPVIIFVTAYDEHALQAFDSNAIDYLLKPIRKERLCIALEKAKVFNRSRWQSLQKSPLGSDSKRSHICVSERGELALVKVADIRFFLADQKYVMARTVEREILIDESLKSLEQEFSDRFVRAHRNALVALKHIQNLEKDLMGRSQIRFRDVAEKIAVSRRKAASIRAALSRY